MSQNLILDHLPSKLEEVEDDPKKARGLLVKAMLHGKK